MRKERPAKDNLIISGILFLVCSTSFLFMAISLINSLANPIYFHPSEHSLQWLPKEYRRIKERFEIAGQRINETAGHEFRYSFEQDKTTVCLAHPFEPANSGNWHTVGIKSWYLSDQDTLVIDYEINHFAFIISICLMIIFGGAATGSVIYIFRLFTPKKKRESAESIP